MARTRTPLRRARTDGGASAVEYALILAGVAAGLLLVLSGLQRTVESAYRATSADIAIASTPQAVATTAAPAPGPATTSPAPSASTSSPAPSASTSSPAPSPTTTTPRTTATPTPTSTRPVGSMEVEAGEESDGVEVGWTSKSKSFSATVTPSGSGSASIDNDTLVFEPDDDTRGAVTVSWKFKDASGNWVTGTTTFWVTS